MASKEPRIDVMAMAAQAAARVAAMSPAKQAYLRRVMATISPRIDPNRPSPRG